MIMISNIVYSEEYFRDLKAKLNCEEFDAVR